MHLNAEIALDLVEGRLAGEQQALWKSHVEECDRCTEDLLDWQQFTADLFRHSLKSAPPQQIERAIRIFSPDAEDASSFGRSILAAVLFDSLLQPVPAGARGATSLDERLMVMRAEEFDVHIRIWRDLDRRQMLGQLFSRSGESIPDSAYVYLVQNGEKIRSAAPDELGEFFLADIPEGPLELLLETPAVTVDCPIDLPDTK